MKKKKFYSGCAAAAALLMGTVLAGCSSDETIEGGESPVVPNAAISYGVGVNGKLTRGVSLGSADVANSALLPNMQVFAYYHPNADGFGVTPGTQYVGAGGSGITVTNTGGVWKEDAANTAYWPAETAPLNFQAIAPASDASFTVTNSVSDNLAHMVANVTVPEDNSLQKDILMANEDGVTQSTHGRSVQLDFKHVLSQVRFKVQTASKQLSGDIEAISLCNIKSTGSVGYHAADDVTDGVNAWKKVVLGTRVADDAVASYAIGMGDGSFGTAQFGAGNAKDVTAADGSLMMLPQTTSKWTTVDGTPVTVAAADAAKNTYIKISCKILNGNTYLVGSENTYGEVYIPFAASWEMGKKYIYTINIGTGTGGFDVNGKPLIQPISYSVDVDEWGDAVNGDVPPGLAESTPVDLGLPSGTLWATCNVGATSPEQTGLYFAWGETTGYTAEQVENGERAFSWDVYNSGSAASISAELTLEQDAAHVHMGGKWRMPTRDGWQELIDYCDTEWTDDYNGTGVAGRVFTSKVNGNSVFFPAAGRCYNSSVVLVGLDGIYWSASWYSSGTAFHFYSNSENQYVNVIPRYYGHSVRGVIVPPPAESTAVDLGLSVKWAAGNVGAENPEDYGLYFAWGETTGYTAEQVTGGERAFTEDEYNAGPAASISADLTLEQDAAHVNLGGNWRMPTKDEYQELLDNCNVVWTDNYNGTGVKGSIFKSKVNGNSVFFPAAGMCGYSSVTEVGSFGVCWSASWGDDTNEWILHFGSGYQRLAIIHRYQWISVRGVCE